MIATRLAQVKSNRVTSVPMAELDIPPAVQKATSVEGWADTHCNVGAFLLSMIFLLSITSSQVRDKGGSWTHDLSDLPTSHEPFGATECPKSCHGPIPL
jgi:hypothetical protein